jgi:hypothetical protein
MDTRTRTTATAEATTVIKEMPRAPVFMAVDPRLLSNVPRIDCLPGPRMDSNHGDPESSCSQGSTVFTWKGWFAQRLALFRLRAA